MKRYFWSSVLLSLSLFKLSCGKMPLDTGAPATLNAMIRVVPAVVSVPAGTCLSTPIQFQVATVDGEPLKSDGGTPVSFAASGPFSFHSVTGDSNCDEISMGVNLNDQQSSGSFRLKAGALRMGTYEVDVAVGDITGRFQVVVTAGGPSTLMVASNPLSIRSGECADNVMVNILDAGGNSTSFPSDVLVDLFPAPGPMVTLRRSCSDTRKPIAVAKSTFVKMAIVAPVVIASSLQYTIYAEASNMLATGALSVNVTPGSATRFVFNPLTSLVASGGGCSGVIQGSVQDAAGNEVALSSTATALSLNSSQFSLHPESDTSCTSPSGVSIAALAKTFRFRLKAGVLPTGTYNLTVSGGGKGGALKANVLPGIATSIAFYPSTGNVEQGTCNGALAIAGGFKDAAGNETSVAAGTSVMADINMVGGAEFHTNSMCTNRTLSITSDGSRFTFYVKATTAPPNTNIPHVYRFKVGNVTGDFRLFVNPIPVAFAINGATNGSMSRKVGCVEYRVQLLGANNALTKANEDIAILSKLGGDSTKIYTDRFCTNRVNNDQFPAGASEITRYLKGENTGTFVLTVENRESSRSITKATSTVTLTP